MHNSSNRLKWISYSLYLENVENTHSKGSYNKIAKVDSKSEKEVSKDVIDKLVYSNKM